MPKMKLFSAVIATGAVTAAAMLYTTFAQAPAPQAAAPWRQYCRIIPRSRPNV